MKQIVMGLLGGILLLTACGQTSSMTQTAPISVVDTAISTPSPIPTTTAAPSITPLPTTPTFTPTFDVSTIVTVTPAPKAECPAIDPTVKPENYLPERLDYPSSNVTNKILEFLNKGGNGQTLINRLDKIYYKDNYIGGYAFRDVTGDQVPEFLYVELHLGGKPIVFSCSNGNFELLATLSGQRDFLEYAMEVDDLNADKIPEIIITGTSGASLVGSTIHLYEWNGQAFKILTQVSILALRQLQIKELNENGAKEVLLIGDNPGCVSCSTFIPQRQRTVTLSWNGNAFIEVSNEFTPPEYRFQAIQDADSAALVGNNDKAIHLYEEVISNKQLEWWSPERMQYKQDTYGRFPGVITSTIPLEDTKEYPHLAAYAYYRLMLLHIVQGHESDADTVYKTLQPKFGNNQNGQPYVEMATEFWDAYQSTHKMYDGCAAAIQYAATHPEILTPLGSDYHGAQSHIYVPADVCPFR